MSTSAHDLAVDLHRPFRKPKRWRKIWAMGVDHIWEVDTMMMGFYDEYPSDDDEPKPKRKKGEPPPAKKAKKTGVNDGFTCALVAVDTFSRWAFLRPIKGPIDSEKALTALKSIIHDSKRKPEILKADEGSEWKSVFSKWCEQQGIPIWHSYSEHKAALAERFIGAIKHKLNIYFEEHHTHRWIDVIQDLVKEYNTKDIHSALKMTPEHAMRPEVRAALWYQQFGGYDPEEEAEYPVGTGFASLA